MEVPSSLWYLLSFTLGVAAGIVMLGQAHIREVRKTGSCPIAEKVKGNHNGRQ
jgi:hypothetical protein